MAKNVIRNRLIITVLLLFAAFLALSMGGVLVLFDSSLQANERMRMVADLRMIRLFLELEIPGEWRTASGELYKASIAVTGDKYLHARIAPYLPPGSRVEFHVGRLPESLKPQPYGTKGIENVIRLFEPRPGRMPPDADGSYRPPAPPSGRGFGASEGWLGGDEFVYLISGGMATKLFAFDGSEAGWISLMRDRAGPGPMDNAYLAFFIGADALLAILTLVVLYFIVFRLSSPIVRLAESKAAAERLSRTDALTGLMNRRGFDAALGSTPPPGKGRIAALALVDIDDFKAVNDLHGHECGDAVLAQFSQTLLSSARSVDLVCRWGGEEFLVYFPDISPSGVSEVLERVREAIAAREYSFNGETLRVTATIGAVIGAGTTGLQAYARRADQALYRGKQAGKNRVVFADA